MRSENVELFRTLRRHLDCDPELSLMKWAERAKSKHQERTVIRSAPKRSHQSNGAADSYQKQLQGPARTMLAALQDRTQYGPTVDRTDEMDCPSCSLADSSSHGATVRTSLSQRAMGGPSRGKLLAFGETELLHLPEVGKGSRESAPNMADRWKPAVWPADEGVVFARSV